MKFLSDKFQLVELVIGATITSNNQDVNFQQQPQLQSFGLTGQKVYIEAIEVFSSEVMPFSPYTGGNPVATPAAIQNATLTLVEDSDKETRKDLPLPMLNRTWPSAGSFVPPQQELYLLKNCFAVSWTKCYVTLITAPVATPFSYMFGVHYTYNPPVDTLEYYQRQLALQELARQQVSAVAQQSISGLNRFDS